MSDQLVVQESSALMALISKAATDPNMDVAKLKELLEVKERWELGEARKAFHEAFAAFKKEATSIVRNKLISDGPLKGKRYADLFAVVDSVVPLMSKFGLSHSWTTLKQEKEWIEVACVLTHVRGHSETRSFGGPPDTGGAKNAMQARASTLSYLQRYTLMMVTGLASSDQDDDGRGGEDEPRPDPWTDETRKSAKEAAEKGAYAAWWKTMPKAFREAAVDTSTHADFKAME